MKFCSSLVLALMLILLPLNSQAKAAYLDTQLEPGLNKDTGVAKAVDKIIFAKVQRQQILNISDQKYAQEFSYFFYKLGFKRSPVSYILFQNGSISTLNQEWLLNQPQTNLDNGIIFVLLVYDDTFNLGNFQSVLTEFKDTTLKQVIKTTNIDALADLETRPFVVESGTDIPIISFKPQEDSASIQGTFNDIDFASKLLPDVKVTGFTVDDKANPNAIISAKITLTNNSDFNYLFNSKTFIQVRFEKDSAFFANNKWLNQRIPLQMKDSAIKAKETKVIDVELNMPVMPGQIKEKMIIEMGGKPIESKEVAVTVNDIGQKVLKIRPTELNYLNIRQDPVATSKEVGRASVGTVYVYTESKNNFHKIIFNNNQSGWISSRYVEVLR